MSFSLQDLARYFDSSARRRKDATANLYGALPASELARLYDEVVQEIAGILQPAAGTKVLDIGCGSGEILVRLGGRCGEIIGVDLAPAMAELVREKGYPALVYDGQRLPFEDERFDAVIVYQVFINLPDRGTAESLVREAARVTRSGGKILVGAVPHPQKSRLGTHASSWIFAAKSNARKAFLQSAGIPYYAYPYEFFGRLLDSLMLQRLCVLPCGVRRPGWETKYHVLFVK